MPEPVESVPFAKPWLAEEEAAAAGRCVLSGWVTQGPEVEAFEREFADYVGAPHACAVSNCTTALHLALIAVGVEPGDEVVTVSHSFIATANVVRYCGATPVFVDIDPATYNIDLNRIEEAISRKTRAILCVHQMGMPCDLARILDIAKQHDLAVVEDAACAAGSEIRWNGQWEKIGRPHADVVCFSFHPRKVLTTGDGGMITTTRGQWDTEFRLRRHNGMGVPDSVRNASKEVIFETYPLLGYNYRMTDIQAAVGRVQLRRLPEIVERRRDLGRRYGDLLTGVPGIGVPCEPVWARSTWQSYCVRLPGHCDQRTVMQRMREDGVATRRGTMCAHREPAYTGAGWRCCEGPGICGCETGGCRRLAESERAQDGTIVLPLFPEMTYEQQDRVVQVLSEACKGG